ncbi:MULTISPECIES: hypothetical protein [unclassified Acinetobacter]|uniref:hypothetical protein n=1 Tax=unclassified Acinetobacter TaxID=196816 RepID=UPI0025757462|nr:MULTISPECIES: hypothetical protein [unclassified Acinetobacter]MDM1764451.1 hypothetical protein [Acinetobacter sp. 226-1]MDM1767426.1 hypothetical protein [Acinetobacter sp. 226-4]
MHVCKTLSQPNENSLQTCLEWQEQKSFLPDLTKQQADEILIAILSCFAVVFIIKRVLNLLNVW